MPVQITSRADAEALIQEQLISTIQQDAPKQSIFMQLARKLPNMTSRQTRMPVLDMVLAVDVSGKADTAPGDYVVVQMGIDGLDAQNNPVTVDKQYIRAGQSTMKTGNQRSFKVSGDRYVGDPFQDYACSPAIMQGVGQAVIVPYVYFCLLNGKGEKGTVSIITNSDASGAAGENAGIDIELKKVGAAPEEYTYTAPAGVVEEG